MRLLRSHSCGVGEPYPDEIVRAAMLLRANALAKGTLGARFETVSLLVECLNRGLLPRVPARGSVGASGDLAPLAHLALPLIGEGEAFVEGRLLPGAEALEARRARAGAAAGEGGALADQRHPVHGGCGRARARARAAAREGRRHRLRDVDRGAAGLADELPAADPRAPAAAGPAGGGRERARRCSRAPRSSRPIAGATRCRTRTRCAARRRCTAPRATCSTTSTAWSRSSSTRPPTTRSCSSRTACSSRTGTSTASRSRSRSTRWRWRSRSSAASRSGASSGSSTRRSRTGCPRS